jgi:hypothetical protein
MIRTLVLIAVAGFFTAMICFTAALSFGGPDLLTHEWGWIAGDWDPDPDPEFGDEARPFSGAQATRELAWTGESLDVDVAGEVHFVQKDGPATLVISGPSRLVHDVQLAGGRISGDDDDEHGWRRVSITITAPRITEFRLDDDDTLVVHGYDQDRLMLTMEGRADVSIQGRTGALTLNIGESADADLSQLESGEVLANVRDFGEVSLAPRVRADLTVADSGKVTLVTRPGQLQTDVRGRGKIIEAAAAPAGAAPSVGEVASDATS